MSPMDYVGDLQRLIEKLGPFEKVLGYNVSDVVWNAMSARRAGYAQRYIQHIGTVFPKEAEAQCSSWLTSPYTDNVLFVPASGAIHNRCVAFGAPGGRLATPIWNGVDVDRFAEARAQWTRARTQESPKYVTFGFAGRMADNAKDWRTMLLAFTCLPTEVAAKVRLVLAGDGPQHDEYVKIIRDAEADPVRGFVAPTSFVGRLAPDEIPDFLAGLDVYVMPALDIEGMSMGLCEAIATSCAVISTDAPSNVEVLNGAGYISGRPGDIVGMRNAICAVARSDELLSDLQWRARARAPSFDVRRMTAAYAELR